MTLIFNPEGNLLHALHNLLNHLNSDILEFSSIANRPSYKIAKNLAAGTSHDSNFQFRLLAVGVDTILLSPVYEK